MILVKSLANLGSASRSNVTGSSSGLAWSELTPHPAPGVRRASGSEQRQVTAEQAQGWLNMAQLVWVKIQT